MKAKGGLRFKSLGEAESKPLQQKTVDGALSQRNQEWIQEVMTRSSGKVPPGRRMRACCDVPESESGTRVYLPDNAFHHYRNSEEAASFLTK